MCVVTVSDYTIFHYPQCGISALHLAAMFGFSQIAAYLITMHGMSVREKDLVCHSNIAVLIANVSITLLHSFFNSMDTLPCI